MASAYKEGFRKILASYTVPEADRAASAGIPIARLPKRVERQYGKLNWKQSVAPQIFNIDLPINVTTFNVAAGAGTASVGLSDGAIPAFATRFGSTFYEYCVVGARLEVVLNQTTNQAGVVAVYVDEKSAIANTAKAKSGPHLSIPITQQSVGRVSTIEWKAQDYDDLLWNAIGTSFNAAYVNLITDSTFGTSGTTTCTGTISGSLALCFRGVRG